MEKWLIPTLEQEMVNRALGNLLFKKKKKKSFRRQGYVQGMQEQGDGGAHQRKLR